MVGAEQPSSVLGFSCSKSPQSAVFLGLKTSCEGGVGAQNQPKWGLLGQGRGGPVAAPSPQTLGGVVSGLWDPHQRWGSGFICP